MPSLLKKAIKVAKRRLKKGLQDYRTWRLYMAGRELLADHDYDRIAVVKIASMAGVSVVAFYERFDSKDAFGTVKLTGSNEVLPFFVEFLGTPNQRKCREISGRRQLSERAASSNN